MKHLNHAKQYLENGQAQKALDIIDHILELAPKNPEALKLKAHIFESWGYFDKSLQILQDILKLQCSLSKDALQKLRHYYEEEKEDLLFTRLTPSGRAYFHFSYWEFWICIFGILGCSSFLALYYKASVLFSSNFWIYPAFVTLVLAPFSFLFIHKYFKVSAIILNGQGLVICKRFQKLKIVWEEVRHVQVVYDEDIQTHFLKLKFYFKEKTRQELFIDISSKSSDVKARRHFTKSILAYVDSFSYAPRNLNESTSPNLILSEEESL
jgi:tetratricopeptide (TPR) repeat protein